MRFLLYFILLSSPLTNIHAQQSPVDQIKNVLASQSEAWNKGDLDLFMRSYWKSDSLLFVSKEGVTYGWKAMMDYYKVEYPGSTGMGKLNFNLLEFKPLAKDLWLVIGKWQLDRTIGNLTGHFTVLFRRIDGKWKIVMDHSS